MTSCQSNLDFNNIINQKESFSLKILNQKNLNINLTKEIKINSEKWIKFIDFLKNNKIGWQSNPASFNGNIHVSQKNFNFTYLESSNLVVINFLNNDRDSKQFTKKINKGELDFLTE